MIIGHIRTLPAEIGQHKLWWKKYFFIDFLKYNFKHPINFFFQLKKNIFWSQKVSLLPFSMIRLKPVSYRLSSLFHTNWTYVPSIVVSKGWYWYQSTLVIVLQEKVMVEWFTHLQMKWTNWNHTTIRFFSNFFNRRLATWNSIANTFLEYFYTLQYFWWFFFK